MADKGELILGFVNDGTTIGAGAASVADQISSDATGVKLLSQSAQTGAVLADITSVTKLAGPYVPIISMPVNIAAGTVTFLKVGFDLREGRIIESGDVLSIVGNTVGVVSTFAVLMGGGPIVVSGLAVASTALGLVGLSSSDAVRQIVTAATEYFSNALEEDTRNYLFAPDLSIVHKSALAAEFNVAMLSLDWTPATGIVVFSTVSTPVSNNAGAVEGASGRDLPYQAIPEFNFESSVFDGGQDVSIGPIEVNKRLCVDTSQYLGGGEALALDPVGCIKFRRPNDPASIYIDYSIESELTTTDRINIIAADPSNAFHLC